MRNQGRIDSRDMVFHRVDHLREALELDRHRIVSLVGAGGKTSLMFAMARELATLGNHVVTSTTTKIFKPSSKETPFLFIREEAEDILKAIPDLIQRYGHFTLAESRLPGKKLRGVSPELIDGLGALDGVDHVLVEADGAARLPLKAPDENEPVIPSETSLVVVVVGIDSLGVALSADHVFRPHIVSELTGLPLGGMVTAEAIAELIVHPRGMAKGAPSHSTIIPFLNKVDIPDGLKKGRVLARRILEKGHPRINRVALGHAICKMPVAAVVSRKVDP
ncbi:MAG: selenium cofactor biosynthesis protein YqeC [Thermodesulfobacteriota bacterium]